MFFTSPCRPHTGHCMLRICTYKYKHITHIYAFQSETPAFVGRKKKFRLAAFMQATMLSFLSKYAGDPSPRVPALPACLHYYYPMACTYAPPPFVFENPHRPKGKKKPPPQVKEREIVSGKSCFLKNFIFFFFFKLKIKCSETETAEEQVRHASHQCTE